MFERQIKDQTSELTNVNDANILHFVSKYVQYVTLLTDSVVTLPIVMSHTVVKLFYISFSFFYIYLVLRSLTFVKYITYQTTKYHATYF